MENQKICKINIGDKCYNIKDESLTKEVEELKMKYQKLENFIMKYIGNLYK